MLFLLACTETVVTLPPVPVDADGDGWFRNADCNDADAAIHPETTDAVCDGVDDDCDGRTDEDVGTASLWYRDADGDGYGAPEDPLGACTQPDGYAADFKDCDDTRAEVHPDAPEDSCDGVDNDCDGDFDEDTPDATTRYRDADGDGFGDPFGAALACPSQDGYVADASDCDDAHGNAHPGGTETCDGSLDEDCDGTADEGCGGTLVANLHFSTLDVTIGATATQSADWARLGTDRDGRGALLVGDAGDGTAGKEAGAVWLLTGLAPGERTLADAELTILGEPGDGLGRRGAWVGDLDGDGISDLAVATPYRADGGAWFLSGAATGIVTRADAIARVAGESDTSFPAVAPAGNASGDEEAGVFVRLECSGCGSGIHLFPAGLTGDLTGADATASLTTRIYTSSLGDTISAGRDVDGDGVDDALVGSSGSAKAAGIAWLFSGPIAGDWTEEDATASLSGSSGYAQFGRGVALVDDTDGDGLPDLLISAPDEESDDDREGAVYLYVGSPSGDLTDQDAAFRFASPEGGAAGASMASAGDVDRDGRNDVIVGGRFGYVGNSYEGGAWVTFGGTVGTLAAEDAPIWLRGGHGEAVAGSVVGGEIDAFGDGAPTQLVSGWGVYDDGIRDREGLLHLVSTAEWFR